MNTTGRGGGGFARNTKPRWVVSVSSAVQSPTCSSTIEILLRKNSMSARAFLMIQTGFALNSRNASCFAGGATLPNMPPLKVRMVRCHRTDTVSARAAKKPRTNICVHTSENGDANEDNKDCRSSTMAVRSHRKREDKGSSPLVGTINAEIAQLAVQRICNSQAAGSSPALSSNYGPVAQPGTRAPRYERGGRTFKSCRGHHMPVSSSGKTSASKPEDGVSITSTGAKISGCSSVRRALALGARGRRGRTCHPDH